MKFDPSNRWRTAGKFFCRGGRKEYLRGLTYGPFGPGHRDGGLPDPGQAREDLIRIKDLGCNSLRLYHAPTDWFLAECESMGISLLISLPWADHVDFLTNKDTRRGVVKGISQEAKRLAGSEAVVGLLVGNEINTSLVRWLGARGVIEFLEELIDASHQAAPETLVAYANYPSTEYLIPENADFAAYNVYLERKEDFRLYLARLQNLAGDRPLLISEFGVDSRQHGPQRQSEMLQWEIESARDGGVAGNFLFAYTDEWHRGGENIDGWDFGIVDRHRAPKPAAEMLRQTRLAAPLPSPAPSFSVIVCTRNGARTLTQCLDSIKVLDYPDYEVIIVDDGSTDETREIIPRYPDFRSIFQEPAGLSVARNTGAAMARGEIIAYTDDDCVVDRDWLRYLAVALADPRVAAAGGPNISPPAENLSQACVIAAPGGPAHVLMGDTVAEHVPGCNLAVRRTVLQDLGGFLPKYHAAGDDVDFCWRLLERGYRIGFHGAAMVWHYRRFTIGAFLRQQRGYGKAEGLLLAQYGSRFGHFGGAQWRGVVYQSALVSLTRRSGRIYSGTFGHAAFQTIYAAPLSLGSTITTSFPWLLVMFALLVNFTWSPVLGYCGLLLLLTTLLLPVRQARSLHLPENYNGPKARILLWFLLLAQPCVRSVSRFYWGMRSGGMPAAPWIGSISRRFGRIGFLKRVAELKFWSSAGKDRDALLPELQIALAQRHWPVTGDDGWRDWDLEVHSSWWWVVRMTSVTEYHAKQDRLTKVRLATRATLPTILLHGLNWAAMGTLLIIGSFPAVYFVAGAYLLASLLLEMHHRRVAKRLAETTIHAAVAVGLETV